MARYSAAERAAIAAGQFFTPAELAAKPWLGRDIVNAAARQQGTRRDPNLAPVSAEARQMAETGGVCAWCYEPGDERSRLVQYDLGGLTPTPMHPECKDARDAERAAR